jgi:hypothetical protein
MNTVRIQDDRFILPSGRTVWVESLTMRHTYAGVLEGGPGPSLTEHIMKEIKRQCDNNVVIVNTDESFLPFLTWIVQFESNRGVVSTHPDYHSTLHVCWFNHRMPDNLYQEIANTLLSVDWENNAQDYNTDNL